MRTVRAMVTEFHKTYGVAIDRYPTVNLRTLRAALIKEEAKETINALSKGSMLEIADGLADLVYVAYGTAVSLGIDLDKAIVEVHRSNMSKLGEDGKPILRDDGKVLKGPNYSPPKPASCLP